MKLNIKISGDVNVYLTPDADPVSLDINEDDLEDVDQEEENPEGFSYFESAVNILKNMVETIGNKPDEPDDADSGKIVMVLAPGKEPKVMTFAEAEKLAPGFYQDYECIDDFLDIGIMLFYHRNQLLRIEDSEYLIGPAVVCFVDADGDLWSLGAHAMYKVFRCMEKSHAVLFVDGKQIVALEISGPEPEEEGE